MRAIDAKLSDDHSSITFTISTEADSLTIVLITTIFCLLVRVLLQLPKLTRAAELAAKGGALPVATGSGLKLATLTPAILLDICSPIQTPIVVSATSCSAMPTEWIRSGK